MLTGVGLLVSLAVLATGPASTAENEHTVKVRNGLAFSEFRGYEGWATIAISENGGLMAVILGNTVMIEAYKRGVPGNGQPFPDGSKMAKIHWNPKKHESSPGQPTVPGSLHDIDFMLKDSKRFADGGALGNRSTLIPPP